MLDITLGDGNLSAGEPKSWFCHPAKRSVVGGLRNIYCWTYFIFPTGKYCDLLLKIYSLRHAGSHST